MRIPSYKLSNKSEMNKFLVNLVCLLKGISLSETEKLVLVHFIMEGYNEVTKEQIVTGKLLKNKSSLANVLTTLRKNKILIRDNFKEVIDPSFRFPENNKMIIDITVEA